MRRNRLITQLCLTGVMTLSALALVSCGDKGVPKMVACEGVSNNNQPINMAEGICKKLAGSKSVTLKCADWQPEANNYVCKDPGSQLTIPHFPESDYVKCYGIVAAEMNDCGTATTACGGSVHVNKQPDAWIAIPNGICKQIKGSSSKLEVTNKTATK